MLSKLFFKKTPRPVKLEPQDPPTPGTFSPAPRPPKPVDPPPPPPSDNKDGNYTGMKVSTDDDGNKVETIYKNGVIQSEVTTRKDGTRTSVVYNYDSDGNLLSTTTSEFNANDKLVQKLSKDKDGNVLSNVRYFYDVQTMMQWFSSDECKKAVFDALGVTEAEFTQKYGYTYKEISERIVGAKHTGDLNGLSSTTLINEIVKACVPRISADQNDNSPSKTNDKPSMPQFDNESFANIGDMMNWLGGSECKNAVLEYLGLTEGEFSAKYGYTYAYVVQNVIGTAHIQDFSNTNKNQLFKEIVDYCGNNVKPDTQPEQKQESVKTKPLPRFNNDSFKNAGELMSWVNSPECKNAVFEAVGVDEIGFKAHCGLSYGEFASKIAQKYAANPSAANRNTLANEIVQAYKNSKKP